MASAHSNRRFTADQEQQIRAEYEAGQSAPQLALRWQCGHRTIFQAIRRAGGTTRGMSEAKKGVAVPAARSLCDADENTVRAAYEAGESTSKLARRWRLQACTINDIVRRQGGVIRSASEAQRGKINPMPRRCTLNEAAFDDILGNPLAAYFAGLLYADGCVMEQKVGQPRIAINVSEKDIELVQAFRSFLGSSHKIRTQECVGGFSAKEGRVARFSVSSRRFADALALCGVVPRKSMTATVPPMLAENLDWWRGVIDGDGWCYFDNDGVFRFGLCGTRDTCETLLALIKRSVPTKANVRPNGPIWSACLGHRNAIRAAALFYDNDLFSLQRKAAPARLAVARGRLQGWLP